MQADRIAAGRLVIPDKFLGLQRPQDVVGGPPMKARGAGDLARIQRPLRNMQDAQHFCRRDNRAYWFALPASGEISSNGALTRYAARLPFARLRRKGAGC